MTQLNHNIINQHQLINHSHLKKGLVVSLT